MFVSGNVNDSCGATAGRAPCVERGGSSVGVVRACVRLALGGMEEARRVSFLRCGCLLDCKRVFVRLSRT